MKIRKNRLVGYNTVHYSSPNHGGFMKPDTIVIHYTAGASGKSSAEHLCRDTAGASAHLVVSRDSTIYQLLPFNMVAWHAGVSKYKFPNGDIRHGFNGSSIGIEVDNAGLLTSDGVSYRSWFNKDYDESDVFFGKHRNQIAEKFWHKYTVSQIKIVTDLCKLLVKKYGIKYILGHEEISPGRKLDPGPAFPLDKMREEVFKKSSSRGLLRGFFQGMVKS